VAVDEKVIHPPDGDVYLRAPIDLHMDEANVLMVSRGQPGLEALAFLNKVCRMHTGWLPRIFIDDGMGILGPCVGQGSIGGP